MLTGQIDCLHCGKSEEFGSKLPLPLSVSIALLKTYGKLHRRCPPSSAGEELRLYNERKWQRHQGERHDAE